MPRPHKCRRILAEPGITMFKPAGLPARTLESVELRLDEFEALRLADLEGLYHDAAAECMGISRATFGRLVEGARRKVAVALVESKSLVFRGGSVAMSEMRVFECRDCGHRFERAYGTSRPEDCPSCGSRNFCRALEDHDQGRRRGGGGRGRGAGGFGGRRRTRCRGRGLAAGPQAPAGAEAKQQEDAT